MQRTAKRVMRGKMPVKLKQRWQKALDAAAADEKQLTRRPGRCLQRMKYRTRPSPLPKREGNRDWPRDVVTR